MAIWSTALMHASCLKIKFTAARSDHLFDQMDSVSTRPKLDPVSPRPESTQLRTHLEGLKAGVHFVLRGKNAGNFELLTYFEVTCYGRVSSGWGYYTLLKFVRHLLFTQLQIPRVMLGRMVGIVSKHERIPKWMCVSEKSTRDWL